MSHEITTTQVVATQQQQTNQMVDLLEQLILHTFPERFVAKKEAAALVAAAAKERGRSHDDVFAPKRVAAASFSGGSSSNGIVTTDRYLAHNDTTTTTTTKTTASLTSEHCNSLLVPISSATARGSTGSSNGGSRSSLFSQAHNSNFQSLLVGHNTPRDDSTTDHDPSPPELLPITTAHNGGDGSSSSSYSNILAGGSGRCASQDLSERPPAKMFSSCLCACGNHLPVAGIARDDAKECCLSNYVHNGVPGGNVLCATPQPPSPSTHQTYTVKKYIFVKPVTVSAELQRLLQQYCCQVEGATSPQREEVERSGNQCSLDKTTLPLLPSILAKKCLDHLSGTVVLVKDLEEYITTSVASREESKKKNKDNCHRHAPRTFQMKIVRFQDPPQAAQDTNTKRSAIDEFNALVHCGLAKLTQVVQAEEIGQNGSEGWKCSDGREKKMQEDGDRLLPPSAFVQCMDTAFVECTPSALVRQSDGLGGGGGGGGGRSNGQNRGDGEHSNQKQPNYCFKNVAIITEPVECGDLRKEIKQRRRDDKCFQPHEVTAIFAQLLIAIAHVHERGFVHRDVKAGNIFLKREGTIKLGDFGYAIRKRSSRMSTNFVGTPFYAAPEVWQEQPYNDRVDIFALGVVFYELLMLRRPFEGKSLLEIRTAILSGVYDAPPPEFAGLISVMLSRSVACRPKASQLLRRPDVQQMLLALKKSIMVSPTISLDEKETIAREVARHIFTINVPTMMVPQHSRPDRVTMTTASFPSTGMTPVANQQASAALCKTNQEAPLHGKTKSVVPSSSPSSVSNPSSVDATIGAGDPTPSSSTLSSTGPPRRGDSFETIEGIGSSGQESSSFTVPAANVPTPTTTTTSVVTRATKPKAPLIPNVQMHNSIDGGDVGDERQSVMSNQVGVPLLIPTPPKLQPGNGATTTTTVGQPVSGAQNLLALSCSMKNSSISSRGSGNGGEQSYDDSIGNTNSSVAGFGASSSTSLTPRRTTTNASGDSPFMRSLSAGGNGASISSPGCGSSLSPCERSEKLQLQPIPPSTPPSSCLSPPRPPEMTSLLLATCSPVLPSRQKSCSNSRDVAHQHPPFNNNSNPTHNNILLQGKVLKLSHGEMKPRYLQLRVITETTTAGGIDEGVEKESCCCVCAGVDAPAEPHLRCAELLLARSAKHIHTNQEEVGAGERRQQHQTVNTLSLCTVLAVEPVALAVEVQQPISNNPATTAHDDYQRQSSDGSGFAEHRNDNNNNTSTSQKQQKHQNNEKEYEPRVITTKDGRAVHAFSIHSSQFHPMTFAVADEKLRDMWVATLRSACCSFNATGNPYEM